MKPEDFVIEVKHRPECAYFLPYQEGHIPWGCPATPSSAFLTRKGRKSKRLLGRHHWLRFLCNDMRCPGVPLVRADAIFAHAPHGGAARARSAR